jgi:hypothetical protein
MTSSSSDWTRRWMVGAAFVLGALLGVAIAWLRLGP